jgi:hypothetical protein
MCNVDALELRQRTPSDNQSRPSLARRSTEAAQCNLVAAIGAGEEEGDLFLAVSRSP